MPLIPHRFDWRLIRSFLAALDAGSLLGASRLLRTTQPTVGRHIAELESQLATVLFERTGRGLRATPAALAMADAARAMEAGATALSNSLLGQQSGTVGTVRIAASTPVAFGLLPAVLVRMRQHLPQTQVELVASNTISNLLRREADIAIRMVRPDQGSLLAKRIGTVELGAWAHSRYLAAHGHPQSPEALLAHEIIGGDTDDSILRGFVAQGFPVMPTIFALKTDDMLAQWAAVRSGLGIGFVANYMAGTEPGLVRVLPQLQLPPLPMWLAVHREIHTNQRIRAVFDFLAVELPVQLKSQTSPHTPGEA